MDNIRVAMLIQWWVPNYVRWFNNYDDAQKYKSDTLERCWENRVFVVNLGKRTVDNKIFWDESLPF